MNTINFLFDFLRLCANNQLKSNCFFLLSTIFSYFDEHNCDISLKIALTTRELQAENRWKRSENNAQKRMNKIAREFEWMKRLLIHTFNE